MTTLAERCKEVGLDSAAELSRITETSRETLTNWMNHKPQLFEVVLKGAVACKDGIEIMPLDKKNSIIEQEFSSLLENDPQFLAYLDKMIQERIDKMFSADYFSEKAAVNSETE